jgi:alkylation response protein AidB-like acyl-CoA dehydrogenase
VDLILERARETGRINDPVVRQEIAKLLILDRSVKWTTLRARAAVAAGEGLGPTGSLIKLAASHVARAAARVHTLISGADAMLAGADAPRDGVIAEVLISVPAVSIAGGTDEIQRNIIAERMLRMPKDPNIDANRPFRDVPKNSASSAR